MSKDLLAKTKLCSSFIWVENVSRVSDVDHGPLVSDGSLYILVPNTLSNILPGCHLRHSNSINTDTTILTKEFE